MPGISLCGEVSEQTPFFVFNAEFLGFCPDDRDEPAGDSFGERCEAKRCGTWVNPQDGNPDPQTITSLLFVHEDERTPDYLLDDEGEEGDVYQADEEPRTPYARFCAMSEREQDQTILAFKMYVCQLIGVSYEKWMPTTEFVLEHIECDSPDDVLTILAREDCPRHLVLDCTTQPAAPAPKTFRGVPSYDSDELLVHELAARTLKKTASCNVRRDNRKSGSRHRHSNGVAVNQPIDGSSHSRKCGGGGSHATKYGRQDWRHSKPRIAAANARDMAFYDAMWRKYEREDTLALMAEMAHEAVEVMESWWRPYRFDPEHELLDHGMLNEALAEMHRWTTPVRSEPKRVSRITAMSLASQFAAGDAPSDGFLLSSMRY